MADAGSFNLLTADAVAACAAVATLVVAICALRIAQSQIKESARISRESEAQESFRDYLKLAVEKSDQFGAQPLDSRSYHYYVVFMLATFEKIYMLEGGDDAWRRTIIRHCRYHHKYLSHLLNDEGRDFYRGFDEGFRALVAEAIAKGAVSELSHVDDVRTLGLEVDEADPLKRMIDQFSALSKVERERQIKELNQYLESPEGKQEFRSLLSASSGEDRSCGARIPG